MTDPFSQYEALLQQLEETRAGMAPQPERRRRRPRAVLARWLTRIAVALALLALPFLVLVGASVRLYRYQGLPTWPALLVGLLLTALLLLIYAAWAAKRISGRGRVPKPVWQVILGALGAYCIYALVYLSSMNVKGGAVRNTYRSLHPLLRVATSTFILADRDLVITDMERRPADYERMGLPLYERSLHFVQADGYAHAVDLRTLGRGALRNRVMQAYFWAMGFRTLRHVGTADHLHVSLPMPR